MSSDYGIHMFGKIHTHLDITQSVQNI